MTDGKNINIGDLICELRYPDQFMMKMKYILSYLDFSYLSAIAHRESGSLCIAKVLPSPSLLEKIAKIIQCIVY